MRRIAWTPKRRWPEFHRRGLADLLKEARSRDPRWSVATVATCADLSHSTLYEYLKRTRKDGRPAPEPTITGAVRLALVLSEALGRRVRVEDLVKETSKARARK